MPRSRGRPPQKRKQPPLAKAALSKTVSKPQEYTKKTGGAQRYLYAIHIARAGPAPSDIRVVDAIATWFGQNRRGYAVRCGDCDLVFDGGLRLPRAFVLVLPALDPSDDGAAIAFCRDCARQTDDELKPLPQRRCTARGTG